MSGEIKENIQEEQLEAKEVLEEAVEETKEEIKEAKEESVKNISKHKNIVKRVEATKELAESKYKEYLEAEEKLDRVIEEFIKLENEILDTTVATSLELLSELGVDSLADERAAISEIKKDNKEELITIKKPPKGVGKGFLAGLVGAFATVAGALVYGAKMANLPINSATFLQKSNLDLIATKYSELLNLKGATAGYGLIGVSALIVGYGLYKIIVTLQKSRNIKYVEKIEKDTEDYIANLDYKISKLEELIEHIKHIESVMKKYDIILQEQNAKIRRMLFIEQPENGVDSLQKASKLEVEKTILILDELLKLMNTPVNDGIEIREESKERLHSANSVINEVIKKLYI